MVKVLHLIETGGPGGAETVLLNIVRNIDKARFSSTVGVLNKGWLYSELQKAGVETTLLRSSGSCDVILLTAILAAVKTKKINLIHSHLPDMNFYAALVGKLSGTPVIATYHGSPANEGGIKRLIKYYSVGKMATKVVSVSNYLAQELSIRARCDSKKIVTVYNGIDFKESELSPAKIELNSKKRELGLNGTESLIGMIANLRSPKGYEYFVRSAALVNQQ